MDQAAVDGGEEEESCPAMRKNLEWDQERGGEEEEGNEIADAGGTGDDVLGEVEVGFGEGGWHFSKMMAVL